MDIKLEIWLQGLGAGRAMRFRLGSCSMVPTLQMDDLVTVAPGCRCRLGDIALFQRDQDLLLHRVVARWGGWIVTKGDGLAWLDVPVPRHAVLGTAVLRERRGRVRRLDRLGARFLGLSCCLTSACVPKLMKILSALKRLGEQSWAWLSNRNENCISSWLQKLWPDS
jgi:hypothetical protein